MELIINEEMSDEATLPSGYYVEYYGSCDSDLDSIITTDRVSEKCWRKSIWTCIKVSLESTVCCGVFGGIFGTFVWWLELNVKMYCPTQWEKVPEHIHRRQLLVDIFIVALVQFWVFSCIAPLCGWSVIKKLGMIYICTLGALLDAINHLATYIFLNYSKNWKEYIGSSIFFATSFTVCYQFAQHCKAAGNAHYNAFLFTLKLNLQFIVGVLVSIPFNLAFLDFYSRSNSFEKTILVCILVIAFAIPRLIINHVVANLHETCTPGNEIMLAVVYLTATTVVSRLMQARIDDFRYFIIISIVHGILNVVDKISLPLRRRIFSFLCCNCKRRDNHQLRHENTSMFLANQTLISIITETTSVIFSSAVAYLIMYYYAREEGTNARYNGYSLAKNMVKRCSIAVGIELIFNIIAVKIHTHLYKIPVIDIWRRKWKSIMIIHMIQVLFIVLYYSQYVNKILLKKHYRNETVTCFGLFKRI